MPPRFYVTESQGLILEEDGARQVLVSICGLGQKGNIYKAEKYLRGVAEELSRLYHTDLDTAVNVLDEAEDKMRRAVLAERLHKVVDFF